MTPGSKGTDYFQDKSDRPREFRGISGRYAAFREAAAECGAVLVEDACHALGAKRGRTPVGKEADLTAFSFHP